jgi:hypothetical protein
VTAAVSEFLETASKDALRSVLPVLETGFAHEEQHQELFLTDIKHVLSKNSFPEAAYAPTDHAAHRSSRPSPGPRLGADERRAGEIGPRFGAGFAFDNEGPLHKAWIEPFELATRPVTNAEYLAFIEDDGYAKAEHWLSDGWAVINTEQRRAPFYWRKTEGPAGWNIRFTALSPSIPTRRSAIWTIMKPAPSPIGRALVCRKSASGRSLRAPMIPSAGAGRRRAGGCIRLRRAARAAAGPVRRGVGVDALVLLRLSRL